MKFGRINRELELIMFYFFKKNLKQNRKILLKQAKRWLYNICE